jgi:RsiW-degrading membrane proteinase PrsW (M82 family)
VLPPLQLMIIAIPTWWLIEVIRYKLPAVSRQREWGLVNFSIFVTTPVLMLVEIVAFLILLAIFALWVTSQPALMAELERAMGQILIAPSDPQALLDIFAPYLSNPWVIAATIGAAALLVPMIEELLKPLGVLLLAGRNPTQADGFVAGALCGAAFGLVESLLYLTNPAGDGWAELAVGRTGTVLLHTATTALVGWALARAWRGRGGLRLLGAYLLAVALHGLWNGLAVLTGFGAILQDSPERSPFLSSLAFASPIGIVLLGVTLFGVLLWGNRRLRQQAALATAAVNAEPRPYDQI